MSKALWNIKLFLIFFGKFYTIPFAVSFTAFSQINSHIKNAALNNTNEFTLRKFFLETIGRRIK